MTPAYSGLYLENAQTNLGLMMEFSTYDLHYAPDEFFGMFIKSGAAALFEAGDPRLIAGMSGVELAYEVLKRLEIDDHTEPQFLEEYSPEYWAGWALAYYQWSSGRPFKEITGALPVSEIIKMYVPYHEMDVSHFAAAADELLRTKQDAPEDGYIQGI